MRSWAGPGKTVKSRLMIERRGHSLGICRLFVWVVVGLLLLWLSVCFVRLVCFVCFLCIALLLLLLFVVFVSSFLFALLLLCVCVVCFVCFVCFLCD